MRLVVEEGDKTITYENVTDYSLVVRYTEAKVIQKEDSRSVGNLAWLLGKLWYTVEFMKREHFYPKEVKGVIDVDSN